MFDYCFSENGLTAYRSGTLLTGMSFIKWLGEEKYKKLVNWSLRYIADLDIPIKRGTFLEFRSVHLVRSAAARVAEGFLWIGMAW